MLTLGENKLVEEFILFTLKKVIEKDIKLISQAGIKYPELYEDMLISKSNQITKDLRNVKN
ncbi:hypothetical protein BTS2_2071 [Bacillus sp. TS-2]|nr:hypothetical protein BTS2_2071 [Bacillus sp. TS-2]